MKALSFFILSILMSGCYSNPHIPAGHCGYTYEQPRFIGEGGFNQIVKGPGNNGFSFLNYNVINIDTRTQTFIEPFKILTKNKVNMDVQSEIILSVDVSKCKEVVEKYGTANFRGDKTLSTGWYVRMVQEPYRNSVRKEATQFTADELKENRAKIETGVYNYMTKYLSGTPFKIRSLHVGNMDFPDKITKEIEKRVAMQEKEAAKEIEDRIAMADAKIRKTHAEGIRDANGIIDSSLTTNYLQFEAIKAQAKMAESPNHTTIYIPVGANGIPLMQTTNKGLK